MPEDLAVALASNAAAKQFFEALDRAHRFAIIDRVNEAKRAETRAGRIANFVEMLARGEAIHLLTAGVRPDGSGARTAVGDPVISAPKSPLNV
ncbi:MAG: YdeI/OmpD-associated family protein [Betaproteobacteria bacterium]|nr:YdeI/OmpD-associated family protein [Betaproteobacteria bacterium]